MTPDVLKKHLWDDDDVEVQHFFPSPKERLVEEKNTKAAVSAGPVLVKPHTPLVVPRSRKWVVSNRLVFPSRLKRTAVSGFSPETRTDGKSLRSEGSTRLKVLLGTVICTCLLWTLWLIVLNIAPNATVNRIMSTESFDNGSFWLVSDMPPPLHWAAVVGLAIVSLSYAFILVKMIWKPTRIIQAPELSPNRSLGTFDTVKAQVEKAFTVRAAEDTGSWLASSAAKLVVFLAQDDSLTRKRANLWLKIGDLAIETVLLFQILEAGTPVPLIAVFTTIVAANSLSCALTICLPYEQIGLVEGLADIFFNFLVVVAYPMLVLTHCLSTFRFDRAKLAINLAVFPPGSFEQSASVLADPVQTVIIYKSLKSLRIVSVLDLFTRVGVNLALCFQMRHVVSLIQNPRARQTSMYPKKHRASVVFFVLFAVLICVFANESIRTSARACEPHPECVVSARRWTRLASGSLTQCPCLMLIDGDRAPKTFEEVTQPKNVTDKVAQLATMGELQTIQLTNRYLLTLPDELRRCTDMKHLSLVYTHTEVMPDWIKTFTKLEYLHVEGTFGSSLAALPDDMFDDMSALTFMHLGVHPGMQQLPSFAGLTSLQSLNLAVFPSLAALPSVDTLHSLERFVIAGLPLLDSMPDLTAIRKLKWFAVVDRGTWCCNGFFKPCNLSHSMCQVDQIWGTPAAICLELNRSEKVPTAGTLQLINKFRFSVCAGEALTPGILEGPPTPEGMAQCNGALYRQCEVPGYLEAMCYSARFMGIACDPNPFPIEMRRRQIAEKVGDPCDPEVEAWLGCSSPVRVSGQELPILRTAGSTARPHYCCFHAAWVSPTVWLRSFRSLPIIVPAFTGAPWKRRPHKQVCRLPLKTTISMKNAYWDDSDGEVQRFSAPATKRSLPPESRGVWASVIPTPKPAKISLKKKVAPAPVTGFDSAEPAKLDGKQRHEGSATGSAKLKVLLGAGLCICLAWTLGLVVLTVIPNAVVNRLMNTESFDDGAFWLIVDTPLPLRWIAAVGLSTVALGYAFVLVKLVFKRTRLMQDPAASQRSVGTFASAKARVESAARDPKASRITSSVAKLAVYVAQEDNPLRKRVNFCLKIGDLVIGTALLSQTLEAGAPDVLVWVLTTIVAANSLTSAVIPFIPFDRIGLAEDLIDTFFDFLMAVGYPMIVLSYCLSTFTFDRAKMAINLAVFPPGRFERVASVIADPVQIDIIHKSLKSLRIMSTMEFFTRVGVNLLFCLRLHRVVGLVQGPIERQRSSSYPKRNWMSATFFTLAVVLLNIWVGESMRTSTLACQPHPECVVHAHRWMIQNDASLTQCPCLTLIDVDVGSKTYAEWMQPKNVTDKVTQLATTGDLQTIQLTNRYLPVLPVELQRCDRMTHLSLVYTHTETMPAWVKEFTRLQYFHVEGNSFSSLTSLPDGLFDDMAALTFLFLGGHFRLRRLPSFSGLTNVKALTIAALVSLAELPAFDHQQHLERLVMVSLASIDSLPDLGALTQLTSLTSIDRGTWCCNGFLGECDLTNPMCGVHPLWRTPAASCLPANRTEKRATTATLAVLDKFTASVCREMFLPSSMDALPTEAAMDQCNGTLYKQCDVPGYPEAMCYNARLMGITCSVSPFPIEMRRRQIRQRVGDACHPEYEAWLGCQ